MLERSRVQWKRVRYAVIAAILVLALLVILDIIHGSMKLNTIFGATIVAFGVGMSYPRGSFASALAWTGISISLFIIALASNFFGILSGEIRWENYQFLLYAVGIVDIACLGVAFLQLRRLVHIRHQRRWAPVKWLLGRLPLGRSGAGVSDAAG